MTWMTCLIPQVALPLEENGTHITLDMEAARAGGVQVPRASRRGKKNNGYDFAKPCPKFFDVAMMDRREQFLQAVALIQIGDAMRKRIQREDLVGATLEHFACKLPTVCPVIHIINTFCPLHACTSALSRR